MNGVAISAFSDLDIASQPLRVSCQPVEYFGVAAPLQKVKGRPDEGRVSIRKAKIEERVGQSRGHDTVPLILS